MSSARSTAAVSMPAARISSACSSVYPCRRSITSTRRVTSSGCGRGTTRSVWPASCSSRAMSSMFSASSRKSSSSEIVSANSSTSAGGFASAATGIRPTRNGAIQAMARRSLLTSRATCGRCTLTTTSSPVRSRAECTCAIDAAARLFSSKRENTASSGLPRSSSTTARTAANGSGGTRSRRLPNSFTTSSGKRPRPDETICPSLMYAGSELLERLAQPARERGARLRLAAAALERRPQRERAAEPPARAREPVRAGEDPWRAPARAACAGSRRAAPRRSRATAWSPGRRARAWHPKSIPARMSSRRRLSRPTRQSQASQPRGARAMLPA